MPLPAGYLPRKGDTLLIRVDVRSDYDNDGSNLVSVAVTGSPHRVLFADIDKIHAIYSRKWNEGDQVQNDWGWFEVIAVNEDQVWAKCLGHFSDSCGSVGLRYTFDANDLEPYVEPAVVETMTEAELMAGLEGLAPPPAGPNDFTMNPPLTVVGSQSLVSDDDIINRDAAANR
jgi:hypothetical protein